MTYYAAEVGPNSVCPALLVHSYMHGQVDSLICVNGEKSIHRRHGEGGGGGVVSLSMQPCWEPCCAWRQDDSPARGWSVDGRRPRNAAAERVPSARVPSSRPCRPFRARAPKCRSGRSPQPRPGLGTPTHGWDGMWWVEGYIPSPCTWIVRMERHGRWLTLVAGGPFARLPWDGMGWGGASGNRIGITPAWANLPKLTDLGLTR